jgi:hypothetical protein
MGPVQLSALTGSGFCDAFARSERSPCSRFEPLGLSRRTTKSCVAICSLLCSFLFLMSFFLSHVLPLILEHSMTRTAIGLYSILNFICTAPQPVIHDAGCAPPPSVSMWLCRHLHMPPIISMLPPLSHVFMFIVLVSFLDISCAYDSFATPWRLTHRRPLTHVL